MKVDYYMNQETGEITENRSKAFEWLRAGEDVAVVSTTGRVIIWEAFHK